MGFDIVLIQLIERWASKCVLWYIAEAPLGAITDTYKKLAAGRRVDGMAAPVAADLASARELVSSQVHTYGSGSGNSKYLFNTISGKYHLPFVGAGRNPIAHKAKYGWRFVDSGLTVATQFPRTDPDLVIGGCLPKHRRVCRAGQSCAIQNSFVASFRQAIVIDLRFQDLVYHCTYPGRI